MRLIYGASWRPIGECRHRSQGRRIAAVCIASPSDPSLPFSDDFSIPVTDRRLIRPRFSENDGQLIVACGEALSGPLGREVTCNVLRSFLTQACMNAPKDDSLDQIECDVLAEHGAARVVVRRVVRKVYDALDVRAQGRFLAVMKRWCDDPSQLTSEMFNGNEGRTPRHNEMLQAFKNNAAKSRLYGFAVSLAKKRTFIIVDADMAKKKDKANKAILSRSKSRVDDLLDNNFNQEN